MKKLFIFLVFAMNLNIAYSQYYDNFEKMIIIGESLKRQANTNIEKINSLVEYIFELKSQIREKQFSEAMNRYYEILIYLSKGSVAELARSDTGASIRNIQYKIMEEVDNYNQREEERRFREDNIVSNTDGNSKTIKMQRMSGNTFMIACKVNGLPLDFIFDTGASDVTLSLSEAVFMLKNGYLSENDILGSNNYQTASGAIQVGTKVILRRIEIDGFVLRDIEASIIHTNNAPLLLGQSALKQLGKIQIDYQQATLTIVKN